MLVARRESRIENQELFVHLAFLRNSIRPPVQTTIWLSSCCLLALEQVFFCGRKPDAKQKRPSHHFSLYTIGILIVPATHVNRKILKKDSTAKKLVG